MPRSREVSSALRLGRGADEPRRRMSEFLLVVIAVGALILVQVGASGIASYVALRDARVASDDLYSYVSTVTVERVFTFVSPAVVLAGTLQERSGGMRSAFTSAREAARPAGATQPPPGGPDGFRARDFVPLMRPNLQVTSATVAFADGSMKSAFRSGEGYRFTERDASGQTSEGELGPVVSIPATPSQARASDPRLTEWFATASGSSDPVWLEPSQSSVTGTSVVGLAVGTFDVNGDFVGVVLVEIDVHALSAYLTGLPLGGDGEAFVLSQERHLVAGPIAYRDEVAKSETSTGRAPDAGDIGLSGPPPSQDPGTVVDDGEHRTLETAFADTTPLPWTLQLRADTSQLSPGLAAFQRTLTVYFAVVALLTLVSGLVILGLRGPMQRLRTHASTDPLTGLANRREFHSRGAEIVAAAAKRGGSAVVVMLDLDRLKDVNDRLGHAQGDAAIRAAAEALGEASSVRDVVARIGGDEFAVVRWLDDGDDPAAVVEEMRLRVAASLREYMDDTAAAASAKVGASAGFAVSGRDGTRLAELLAAADEALVEGKRSSRGATYSAAAPR